MFTAKDSVYGQCWTFHSETDAMWRIYSPDKQGAKIKTTPRKMLEALKENNDGTWELRCFIGQVEYLNEPHLLERLSHINPFDTNGSGIAKSLLYKREEFSHEKEVRIIYSAPDNESTSDIYTFKIDPCGLFEEIIFDPRMDVELVLAYKLAIKDKKFSNRVDQSSLYEAPKGLTIQI